jgi:hypothetical protein
MITYQTTPDEIVIDVITYQTTPEEIVIDMITYQTTPDKIVVDMIRLRHNRNRGYEIDNHHRICGHGYEI